MSPLNQYRAITIGLADSVRWACTLEAISPKFGNVHPAAPFSNLCVSHFLQAAEHLADAVDSKQSVGQIVLDSVKRSVDGSGTNVNLGIALLIAPLAKAHHQQIPVSDVLASMTAADASGVYRAISLANPGGLGKSEEMDVSGPPPEDLLAAMRYSRDRDLVAKQYADNYSDLFESVVPTLERSIEQAGDMLLGIRLAQIELLTLYQDSLILRKCGFDVAEEVRLRAIAVMTCDDANQRSILESEFDHWLRADGNRRNPGTIADLIAAGLFCLLLPQ
jgi:triphosphoribosyl-dephospho-CoA synthase